MTWVCEACGQHPLPTEVSYEEYHVGCGGRCVPLEGSEIESLRTQLAEANARLERLERQRDEARQFGERAADWYNNLLAAERVLRCAFCDAEYPPGTPPTQHEALTAHVHDCPSHPLRERAEKAEAERDALRAENARLRAALREVDAWNLRWAEGLDSNVERIKSLVRRALGDPQEGE